MIESKARWDAGGKELYSQKGVGTGPFTFVERTMGAHVPYKRVPNHWRQTPASAALEFRWVPEDVTRLASLLSGAVHISDVPRSLHRDALAKGMQVVASKLPAIQHQWQFGGPSRKRFRVGAGHARDSNHLADGPYASPCRNRSISRAQSSLRFRKM